MKYRVAELEGARLDAAVAHTLGWKVWEEYGLHDGYPVWLTGDKESPTYSLFKPSFAWRDAGPIIERERIAIYHEQHAMGRETSWVAGFHLKVCDGHVYSEDTSDGASIELDHAASGPTPLIAAMRAYVASKFGEEVELP